MCCFWDSCNIYNNVSTVTLWEEYGISAYNFATSDQSMCTSYYFLKSALSRAAAQASGNRRADVD